MTQSTFTIRQRGIKMFPEANRLDFVLEDPQAGVAKASIYFKDADSAVSLGGTELTFRGSVIDPDSGEIVPGKLRIQFGDRLLTMGLVQKEGKREYYYRGLETANDAARPKSVADILSAIEAAQPQSQPEGDDEIPF